MYGYVKVGSAVPKLRVADCVYNKEEILKLVEAAAAKQVRVLSFPELSVTGYTCADLFFQTPLLHAAEQAIQEIAEATKALKDKNLGIKVDSREDSEKYEEGTVSEQKTKAGTKVKKTFNRSCSCKFRINWKRDYCAGCIWHERG